MKRSEIRSVGNQRLGAAIPSQSNSLQEHFFLPFFLPRQVLPLDRLKGFSSMGGCRVSQALQHAKTKKIFCLLLHQTYDHKLPRVIAEVFRILNGAGTMVLRCFLFSASA